VLMVRSRLRGASARLWLDGVLGALGAACVAAVFLFEPLIGASAEPGTLLVTDVAYPVGDLLLLAVVTGVFGLTGWRPGRAWAVIGAGFVATAIADGLFVYQATLGSYVDGSLIDAMWPASTLLLGWAAWVDDGDRAAAQTTTGLRVLIVTSRSASPPPRCWARRCAWCSRSATTPAWPPSRPARRSPTRSPGSATAAA
jgi:hypothetical protein